MTLRAEELKLRCRGAWKAILPHFGINPDLLKKRHGPCPMCGGHDRFRFDDKDGDGTWLCNNCGAGDALDMIQKHTGIAFREILQLVREVAGITYIDPCMPKPEPKKDPDEEKKAEKRAKALREMWEQAVPLFETDPVMNYLEARGIFAYGRDVTRALRLSRNTFCKTGEGKKDYTYLPAMIARVDNPAGELVGIHRTYLQPGEPCKARIEKPKRLMPVRNCGDMVGSAIRLYEADGIVLGVTEGIETALSARRIFGAERGHHLPVWATISAGGLASVQIPAHVRHVIIFADHDPVGIKAAHKLAERLQTEGRTSEIKIPEIFGEDFNDVLMRRIGK